MIPTPHLTHFNSKDYEKFYEPAEDTFLLLDAFEEDFEALKSLRGGICLEIGSGSGCVITFLEKLMGSGLFLSTDINPDAAQATLLTASKNKARARSQTKRATINPIITNFTQGLDTRLHKSIDVLVFNPPYVVTPSEEVGSNSIEAAWAGGIDGREVIDKMLPTVQDLLSPRGVFYLVLILENRPQEIMNIMKSQYGFESKIITQRKAGREKLYIVRFSRVQI
ncbi:hemK methyltransferase family member 2-like protein [Basidiobolus meristosporus CBS 931.73]|uniref:HemK methyltransferase family member 2-like protein n=1 Tax=Basidiobolus meristosporus CBS 931.73 TaxID=1314790 RepID=A0A1Y1Y5X4_9FUNG|nr:hemK methyltransferase family member 2-like protein [Basidiobolus meristosporus CBS 931.73]|eukprot:ORX93412.1 hemK methyltransferase family member 2-like protein [Basidiobolus meristosporus CBS 931.73]